MPLERIQYNNKSQIIPSPKNSQSPVSMSRLWNNSLRVNEKQQLNTSGDITVLSNYVPIRSPTYRKIEV